LKLPPPKGYRWELPMSKESASSSQRPATSVIKAARKNAKVISKAARKKAKKITKAARKNAKKSDKKKAKIITMAARKKAKMIKKMASKKASRVTKTAKKKKSCSMKQYQGLAQPKKDRQESNVCGGRTPVKILTILEQSAAPCMAKIKSSSKVASKTEAALWRSSKGVSRQNPGPKPFRLPAKLVGTVSKAEAKFSNQLDNHGLNRFIAFKMRMTTSKSSSRLGDINSNYVQDGCTFDARVKGFLCQKGRTRRLSAKETLTRSGVSFGCDCQVLSGISISQVLSGMPNTFIKTQKKCFKEFTQISLWLASLAQGRRSRPPRILPRRKAKSIMAKFIKATMGPLVAKACEVKKRVAKKVQVEKKDNGKKAAKESKEKSKKKSKEESKEKSKEKSKKKSKEESEKRQANAEIKEKRKAERAAKSKGERAEKAETRSKTKYKAQQEAMEKTKRLKESKTKKETEGKQLKEKQKHRLAVANLKKEVEAHVAKEMARDPSNPVIRKAKMKEHIQQEKAKEARHKTIMSQYMDWEKKNAAQPAT